MVKAPNRRILFIEKAFQLRFIAKVTVIVVLGTVLTGGLLYLLADKEFGRAFYSAHYQARSSWELLLPAVLVSSFVAMFFVAVVAVILTLYDSHKIGGPLYRFRMNLQTIAEGDLTLVTHLREGDELQPLIEAMNSMTRGLRERLSQVCTGDADVQAALAEAMAKLESRGSLDAEDLQRVADARARVGEALGAFRI